MIVKVTDANAAIGRRARKNDAHVVGPYGNKRVNDRG
jgi:hypothetical protein